MIHLALEYVIGNVLTVRSFCGVVLYGWHTEDSNRSDYSIQWELKYVTCSKCLVAVDKRLENDHVFAKRINENGY